MASSILVKDVLYRVSAQLHDLNPQFTRWTQKELVLWLNDGQKAIAKYMPSSCSRVDSIKLSVGTKQSIEKILAANVIPGDGGVSADVFGNHLQTVIRNMGSGSAPGKSVRVVDREVLDANDPDWHTRTATSVATYTFDPRYPKIFYVSPGVPVGGNMWVELSYLADPVTVSNLTTDDYTAASANTTKTSIDDKYVDDLVNYILARAYMKDAEFAANGNLAGAHAQMFTSSINAQVAALTGVNPNLQSLPLSPLVSSVPPARS